MTPKSFLADISGNFAITFGLCAIPVALTAGIAIEYSQVSRYDVRLQNAVDAATLAAGNEMSTKSDNQIRSDVREYLESDLESGDYAQVNNLDIDIDRTKMSLTVSADGAMATSFANIVRIKKLDYSASASVQASWGGIEAVLVLDNTGSMSRDGKMDALKKAATSFVAELLKRDSNGSNVKVGLVPFSEYVNIGTGNASASWLSIANPVPPTWQGCVGSRQNKLDLADTAYGVKIPAVDAVTCPAALTDLTNNQITLNTNISAMVPVGYTYIPAGLVWGLRMLSSKLPLTAASTDQIAKRNRITKTIILMTDGDNTISANPPLHDGKNIALANASTTEVCDNIKKDGVELFTVTFGTAVPPDTQALMLSCASGPGYYFDANTNGDLKKAFDEIAQKLTRLYLTQ